MTMGKDDRLEDLTLATIGDGGLEEMFQERLEQARQIFEDAPRLQVGSGRTVTVTIDVEVELELNLDSGTFSTACRANAPKGPKRRRIVRAAYLREGSFKMEREPIQESFIAGTGEARAPGSEQH